MAASSANTEDVKLNRVRLGRSSNWDYVHRCVAMVMGMGSLWRFPMLAYEQGRGAFLICYLIMTFLLAMPLCQIEIALAQFSGSSIKALWKCMPLGRGIGVAGCFCAALVSVYQALVVAYAATYLGDSVLYPQLPWTACGPAWGADAACYGLADAQLLCGRTARLPVYLMSGLLGSRGPDSEPLLKFPAMPVNDTLRCKNATLPSSEQFFYKRVLALSPSIGDFGHLRPDLIAYLCAVWLTTFFHVCGAAKFFGKIWHQAAQHSVFNLGTWFGPLHYLSSRNDFYLDTRFSHVFLAVNAVLYNMAGSVMTFSAMGHMAALRGSPTVPDAERPGQAVPFIALPMALGSFTFPRAASGCFFAAFILQSLAAQLALVNSALQEMLVDLEARLPSKKTFVTLSYCFICFLLSCVLSSQNGFYMVHLLDAYVGGLAVPIVALYGIVAVVWIYGPHNVCRDVEFLRGRPVGSVSLFLWRFACPVILLVAVLSPVMSFSDSPRMGRHEYPLWANALGCLAVVSCLAIIGAVSVIVYQKHNRDVKEAVKPHFMWGPKDPALLDAYKKHRSICLRLQRFKVSADQNTSMQRIGYLPE
ncbi:sodium-dependent proline transporter-like isoform X3 [Dermacentor albipictus]|uniref:sodium-dependent proline transporter-like isoform X3 n=1 Tax=Dermacentor albipictus TaxID=60249 RepID=UPI0038FCA2D5